MLKARTRWIVEQDENESAQLAKTLGIEPIVAKLLWQRGIYTEAAAKQFLYSHASMFHDPFQLNDMERVVHRIEEAVFGEEKVLIFGDYDADGVTSTSILYMALKEMGAQVDYYIPNRFTEGYGPNEQAFRLAKENGVSLIITVDTGISAAHEATVAKQLGMDLIITDHHEVPPNIPDCYGIIHPKRSDSTYPFKELSGAGVALKIAHALLGEVSEDMIGIAAIGTIADLVPLVDENRLIAMLGIKALDKTALPGLIALKKVCSLMDKPLSETDIGFAIGPRINAIGRLESATPAVRLLTTNDPAEAEKLAKEIDELNRERQVIVTGITEEAIQEVEKNYPASENHVLVIAKENWNPGVIGIVASRLVEKYYRPTIVLSIDHEKGLVKGSARSIVGFDMFNNLSLCRDILPHFGGHPMAAGMTLKLDDVDSLRERLNTLAKTQLTEEDFIPQTVVEIECNMADISLELVEQMQQLAPFGVHNPRPKVLIKNTPFSQLKKIGSKENHLKLLLKEGQTSLDIIGFGFGEIVEDISPLSKLSVVGELSVNEWNNVRKPQLILKDVAVEEWQLFDYRGNRNVVHQLKSIPEPYTIIVFRDETENHINVSSLNKKVIKIGLETETIDKDLTDHIVLLDLPYEKEQLIRLFANKFPKRIYAIMDHQDDRFFATIPTREHFKWFYAFMMKQKEFHLEKHATMLAKRRGWTKETIKLMSKVFFELDFVKISNGLVTLVEQPLKKDLTASSTYRRMTEQLEIEQDLFYSSYHHLKQWFDSFSANGLKIEEDIK